MATVKKLDGRRWTDAGSGSKVAEKYEIYGQTIGSDPSWTYSGIPAIGAAHPNLSGMYVDSIDFEEGTGSEKARIIATVNYGPKTSEGGGSGTVASLVSEWGWDAGTDDKELISGADGTAVLNSAGDVFESVPSVSTYAPVFTKVIRFGSLQTGALACNCKVNDSAITIAGLSCPVGSLMASVAVKKLLDVDDFKYQYTVQLKYKSNVVKLGGASTLTDIGHDVAVTDAGMREKDSTTGKLKLIKQIDSETGKRCVVTSPELLDGSGAAVARTSQSTPQPYNIRFQAYERASFPSWFYSEPT